MRACSPSRGAQKPYGLTFGDLITLLHQDLVQMKIHALDRPAMINDHKKTVEKVFPYEHDPAAVDRGHGSVPLRLQVDSRVRRPRHSVDDARLAKRSNDLPAKRFHKRAIPVR